MNINLPEFQSARVLIVGDVMLDRYWSGDSSRISPEAPVPVVRVSALEERPGGAGNVALNVVGLGAHAAVLGVVGADEAGNTLDRLLQSNGGILTRLLRGDAPTITKLRVLSRHQQLVRLDFEDSVALPQSFESQFASMLSGANALVLSDYAKGTLGDIPALIAKARAASKPVFVDPKRSDFGAYRGATLVTPNMGEFEAAAGCCANETELVGRGRALMRAHDIQALLITRSEHGMTLLEGEREPLHIPAQAREVFDVTGAGDTVIATLAAAFGSGASLAEAARIANAAAGIVVGKLGAATVSVPELRRAMLTRDSSGRGVVDEPTLKVLVEDARAHGERIVMTNGCFDILHAGHVAYLEAAARRGDRLVVAVNDDGSVRHLKGDGRPLVPLAQRMTVLAGLRAVDWVVPFSEDTPHRLVCELRPDVLVKGGDYRPGDVAGGECAGGVEILDFVEGVSTSAIVSAARGGEAEPE